MLQRGMVVALTAVVATIMTTESLLAQASSIKKFADLSNRKVCAIHDSEAYTFLTTQMQTQMNVIQNIGSKVRQHDRVSKCTTCYCGHMWTVLDSPNIFAIRRRCSGSGSSFLKVGVELARRWYDWLLLQVGYIYNGQENATRMAT